MPSAFEEPVEPAPLVVEQRDAVRWIRLNRPHKRNALDPALVAALDHALSAALDDEDTRALVIAGAGPSFCSGADLDHMLSLATEGGDPISFLTDVTRCFARIEQAPLPVVAAVHGHAVAGGLELALACDAVIAATGTLIGDGHVRNGLLPGGGASYRLPRKVGEPLARRMILGGELLSADALLACGFVHSVVPIQDLAHAADNLAELLGTAGRGSAARVKRLLNSRCEPSSGAASAHELRVFSEHWHGSDIADHLHRFTNPSRKE